MQKKWKAEDRMRLLLSFIILGVMAALIYIPSQSRQSASTGIVQRTTSQDDRLGKMYDIREDLKNEASASALESFRASAGKNAAVIADIRDGFVRGEEELKQRIPHAKVEYNTDIRTPEVITPDVYRSKIEFLTQPSNRSRVEVLRDFIKQNSSLIGVDAGQADRLKVAADYTNPSGYMSFVEFEQRLNDIPVFRGEIKAGFTKDGRIIRVINNLAPGMDQESLSTDFRNPLDAVRAAYKHIGSEPTKLDVVLNEGASTDLKAVFGNGDWATTAEKMYFPTEPGVARAAWRVLIWQPVNAFYVIVDAETGTTLWHKNIADDQTTARTYQVYGNPTAYIDVADSPAVLTPGPTDPGAGTQGVYLTRTNRTLIGNEGPLSFNNNGWITDGQDLTDGNNVEAGIDRDGTNGVDPASRPTGSPANTYTSTWNPPPGNPAPGDEPLTAQAQRGAVIQMFYVMNRYHDELYKLGFTEQARNFQASNFGRGGVENDRVSAEGQDSAGSNNANFATPADGGRGRMQMFLWTGPTPDYDGTTDADVIIHEVTHGTSNRLHGNGSGLGNQGGMMGEGWSDWYAHVLLSEPTDPINGTYTTGGYALFNISAGFTSNYYYGIRKWPKAVKSFTGGPARPGCGNAPCPHNPLSFRHINAGCFTDLGNSTTANISAFPHTSAPVVSATCSQVHNAGEIWSSALWEVRSLMVQRLGWQAGSQRVLQVVTDGMKLAPLNPMMLQERDAIIAAAAALPAAPEAAADVVDVREGFRIRGMGFSASTQSSTAVTEAFDSPNAILSNPFSVSDSTGNNNGVPEPNEPVLLNIAVNNPGVGSPITGVTVSVNGGTPVNYGTINDGATVSNAIPYTVSNAACGATETVNIVVSSSLGSQPSATRSFTLGTPIGIVENFDGVTAPTLPAGWTTTQDSGTGITWSTTATGPSSAPNSAFANDPAAVSLSSLVSPSVAISSASAQLKFKNKFATETGFDGMVLEVKIGDGAFQDILAAGGSFASGGYNTTLATGFSNPLPGRQAWSGTSAGGTYVDTVANLPAGANGQNVQFRWRMGSDSSVSSTGVNVDDVQIVSSFTCAPITASTESRADFDGDGKTDVSVFRPSEGNWYANQSTAGFGVINWGLNGDTPTPGDFDGDGKTDVAVFRPNADSASPDFYVLNSNGLTVTGISWGVAGDIPVIADYDGDDKEDVAVFRPSDNTWYVLNSGGGISVNVHGQAGDVPVAGDFDGDGKGDRTVYRSGTWHHELSGGGTPSTPFGSAGDILVPADYDGDNKDDVAIFRPSTGQWIYKPSTGGADVFVNWGTSGDVPVPGDYDGDGKDDFAIYRNGQWWLNRSTAGVSVQNFGLSTDIALPHQYLP